MDERQLQERGKICTRGCIGMLVYLLAAAFLNDFKILDIQAVFGLGDFLIITAIILLTYISVATILKDAYFGPNNQETMRRIKLLFTILAVLEDALFIYDCIQMEAVTPMTIVSIIMSNSIAICLHYKQHQYKKEGF